MRGALHCAARDGAANGFGRDDGVWVDEGNKQRQRLRLGIAASLAVEVVGLDVCGDGGGCQAGAGVAQVEAMAEFGGGDVVMHSGEEMDAGSLGGSEGERGELGQVQKIWSEWEAGAGDNDPLGECEQLVG